MLNTNGKIEYKGKEYTIVFNLNVMESIQAKYGTIEKWGELTDGQGEEVDIQALIFGLTEMINEGIDIFNEDNGTKEPFFTHKQVGRILSEVGLSKITEKINETVVNSTNTGENPNE
ncbi:MAG: hypothetical protein MJZ20_11605 [Bacteroidaceae bacterium]|nr:hypothetical protein [Bacteroidaceae bacterium]